MTKTRSHGGVNVQVAQRQVGVDVVRCIDGEREALDPPRGIKEMMECPYIFV